MTDNEKLVNEFNASRFSSLDEVPDFYTFKRGMFYSHRDFDSFYKKIRAGERSAIVTGLNPSATLQYGHRITFDTARFFQKEYGIPVYVPLSDDESYLSKKVKTRKEAVMNAVSLAADLLAFGFDKKLTKIVIDFNFTEIFNIAVDLSRHVTMSEIKAVYGYKNEDNVGIHFYPAVQAAHVLLPQMLNGVDNVLVPIGPDEDAHLRLARDIAERSGYKKPAVIHNIFLPGLDGSKMSKSKPESAIFFVDKEDVIRKKISKAFSGGRDTEEEHRKYGGNPDIDVSFIYLSYFFLDEKETKKFREDYSSGKMLSGEIKKLFMEKAVKFNKEFQKKRRAVKFSDLKAMLLDNSAVDKDLRRYFKRDGL